VVWASVPSFVPSVGAHCGFPLHQSPVPHQHPAWGPPALPSLSSAPYLFPPSLLLSRAVVLDGPSSSDPSTATFEPGFRSPFLRLCFFIRLPPSDMPHSWFIHCVPSLHSSALPYFPVLLLPALILTSPPSQVSCWGSFPLLSHSHTRPSQPWTEPPYLSWYARPSVLGDPSTTGPGVRDRPQPFFTNRRSHCTVRTCSALPPSFL
jgi:hypothetical protein